ncbi:G1/S-specific cyclin-D1-like [Cetorhinus maximus]
MRSQIPGSLGPKSQVHKAPNPGLARPRIPGSLGPESRVHLAPNPGLARPQIPGSLGPKSRARLAPNPGFTWPQIPGSLGPESRVHLAPNPGFTRPQIPGSLGPESRVHLALNPGFARPRIPDSRGPKAFSNLTVMELLLLNKLQWDIAAPTALEFVERLIGAMGLPRVKEQVVRRHTETFITLCTIDCEFLSYPPSMIGAASLAAAVTGLRLGHRGLCLANRELTDHLARSIRCNSECLKACQERVEIALQARLHHAQRDTLPQPVKSEELERSRTPTDIQDVNL